MSRRSVAIAAAVVAAIAAAFFVGKGVGGKHGEQRVIVGATGSAPAAVAAEKSIPRSNVTSAPVTQGHSETRVAEGRMSRPERQPDRSFAPPPTSTPVAQPAAPFHVAPRVVDFKTEPPDRSGDVWFYGEALNGSPTETQSVEVMGTAYDEQGGVISTSTTYVYPSPLPPMARGTFRSYVSSRGVPIAKVDVQAIDK
jgi:hypothetical protein